MRRRRVACKLQRRDHGFARFRKKRRRRIMIEIDQRSRHSNYLRRLRAVVSRNTS
jgi:hypothetical protein